MYPFPQVLRARVFHAASSLLLGSLLCACHPGTKISDAGSAEEAIVRGKAIDARDVAAQSVVALVAVVDGGQALCTGTLLSDDTVLTAAHCVDHSPSKLIVVFSSHVSGTKAEQMRSADAFTQNPRWHKATSAGRGDLAIVHFSGGLVEGFKPVHFAPRSLQLEEGTETLMLGYGVTNGMNRAGAGTLRETKTTVVGRNSSTEILTDGHKSSVCFGDSGGPAFVMKGARVLQWGVASSVTNEACNESSVHTDVRPYLTWLRAAAKKLRIGKPAVSGPERQTDQPVSLQTEEGAEDTAKAPTDPSQNPDISEDF